MWCWHLYLGSTVLYFFEEITDLPVKLLLIDTLQMVTERKVYVETKHARLTKTLANYKKPKWWLGRGSLHSIDGDFWVSGKEGASGGYFGAGETLPRCEGMHPHTNHLKENWHLVFPGRKYREIKVGIVQFNDSARWAGLILFVHL
jgi:hypothetical protein